MDGLANIRENVPDIQMVDSWSTFGRPPIPPPPPAPPAVAAPLPGRVARALPQSPPQPPRESTVWVSVVARHPVMSPGNSAGGREPPAKAEVLSDADDAPEGQGDQLGHGGPPKRVVRGGEESEEDERGDARAKRLFGRRTRPLRP